MSSELYSSDIEDDGDDVDAVNDDEYTPRTRSKSDPASRRRIEALLEQRRLERLINDDWDSWDEDD